MVSRELVPWVCPHGVSSRTDKALISTHQVYALAPLQSLATSAGYHPIQGPDSSCLGPNVSGKCGLPWNRGTKAVSSIVLIATRKGTSFSVHYFRGPTAGCASYLLFQVITLHDHRLSGSLQDRWWVATFGSDPDTVCWAAQFASMSSTYTVGDT